jgi:hypothetical protein
MVKSGMLSGPAALAAGANFIFLKSRPTGFAGGVAPHGYDVAFMPTVSRPS